MRRARTCPWGLEFLTWAEANLQNDNESMTAENASNSLLQQVQRQRPLPHCPLRRPHKRQVEDPGEPGGCLKADLG